MWHIKVKLGGKLISPVICPPGLSLKGKVFLTQAHLSCLIFCFKRLLSVALPQMAKGGENEEKAYFRKVRNKLLDRDC